MKPFHIVAVPHDDILQGRLTMDVFAADLWDVSQDQGVDEYRDPETFFRRTYLTRGLKNLLDVVEKRLKGRGGDPVIQIQTPFGGGKTHSLIAMYHRAKEWGAKRAVVVGTALDPKDPAGTIWGVIEKQLTSKVKILSGRTSPGKEKIKLLLKSYQPVLILIDEILEYATKSSGVRVGDSTLSAQTSAFIQELTEVASTLESVCLVVTLPTSAVEHYDENAEKLFRQLQHVTGRYEKIYTPVVEEEISRIIRQRLFSQVDLETIKNTVSDMVDYITNENIMPGGVQPGEYKERFVESFPFMPDVIDILYKRWGSFYTFQRTRGVLRLLSLVIYDLKESSLPYISLADFNLNNQEIRRELLKHIGNEFDSVIASDITGPESGAELVNGELGKSYAGLRFGTRAATTIFLCSFSGGPEHGVGINGIKRSAAVYPNPSNVVAEATERLKNKLFYLQIKDDRYYFSNQPNLNRIILTYTDNVDDRTLPEIEKNLLRTMIKGGFFRTYLWEENSGNIVDSEELKLVILTKKDDRIISDILLNKSDILLNKGMTPRVNKNTIFFLYPAESERPAFISALKRKIALENILKDNSLSLTEEQEEEIKLELGNIEDSLKELLRKLYRFIGIPAKHQYREMDLGSPVTGVGFYIDRDVFEELKIEGNIITKLSPNAIKEKYLKNHTYEHTEKIYKATLSTPGEMRFSDRRVLEDGIKEGVMNGVFGVGVLEGDKPKCQYFKKPASVALSGNEIIIDASICEEQIREKEKTEPGLWPGVTGEGEERGGYSGPQSPEAEPANGPRVIESEKYNRLQLRFSIPKGKVSNIMGMMHLLNSRFENLEITISASEGSISENEIEERIKETFIQTGIDDYEISKD